jgi:hypothetical protein
MATQANTRAKQPISTGIRSLVEALQELSYRDVLLSVLLMLAGLILWVVSLPRINLSQMNDLGLISVMPPGCFIALVLLTISFALVIKRPKPVALLAVLELGVLLYFQHGLTALVEPIARFGPSWRHVGVIDYILRNGSVNPRIDAYFNWPGFFGAGALLTQAAGMSNAALFLPWTSLVFELLYLCPLWMIYTSFSDDRRLAWAGLWIFALSIWVGQDYFSPQGLNFFFYLVMIAILLRWFRTRAGKNIPAFLKRFLQKMGRVNEFIERLLLSETGPQQVSAPIQEAAAPPQMPGESQSHKQHRFEAVARLITRFDPQKLLILILLVVYMAIIVSHQLTPFAVLIAVSLLVLADRITTRSLPVLMLILLGTWISYMTSAFMNSRIETLLGQAGNVDQLLGANLVDRMVGSPDHQTVVLVRMLLTGGLWLLALLGVLRRWRAGYTDTSAIILTLSPFLLAALQAYGGEMLLRVFLFSLPFVAFMAAALFFPQPVLKNNWTQVILFGLITLAMTFGFFFVRYGNERMESFTLAEQKAVQYLYETAPEGSLLASSTSHMPYKYQDYEKYRYALFSKEILSGDFNTILTKMSDSRYKFAFLIITRAQKAQLAMFYSYSDADMERFQQELLDTSRFKLIYSNEDADIYQLTRKGTVP